MEAPTPEDVMGETYFTPDQLDKAVAAYKGAKERHIEKNGGAIEGEEVRVHPHPNGTLFYFTADVNGKAMSLAIVN